MRKVESNLLTPNQFTKIIILSTVGVGLMHLPNDMVKLAKQDGWITVIISSIYPFYIILTTLFLSKNHPNENILILSRKYLGNIIGNIMNFIFLIIFIIYLIIEAAGINNFLNTYIISFISSFEFLLIFISVSAFIAYRSLKVLGTLCEIVFYNFIVIGIAILIAYYRGNILNIMPVMGSGMINIVKGTKNILFSYWGIEIILLIYPRIYDKSELKASSIKAVLIICGIYTFVTFSTIYYLGTDLINKTIWSALFTTEGLRLPIINNFRFVVMFLWTIISITLVSLYYYSCVFIITDLFSGMKRKNIFIVSIPAMVILSLFIGNEVMRRELIEKLAMFVFAFYIVYLSLITLLVAIKKGNVNEN